MKKQPEVTEATRQKIIDSFWSLFQHTEIKKITVNRISAEAGIHRSSFYRYFPDIYAVFEEAEKRLLISINAEIEEIRKETAARDLENYISKTSVILIRYADKLYRLLNSSYGEEIKKRLLEKLKENMAIMFSITDSKNDLDYYATFIGTIMLMNLNYWYERKDKITFREISAKGQAIVGEGLLKLQKYK